MIARRGFLLGAAATAAAAALAACGTDDPVGIATSGSFDSRYRRQETGWTVVRPDGHKNDRLPVLVALHPRGGDHDDVFAGSLHLDRTLADVVHRGAAPFAIAAVDGGHDDYWHPRRASDSAGMVINEFLPLLARQGLATDRVGLIGWSMGGYGALYLGTVLGRARVAALVAASPAIWHTAQQRVEGSFDSDADFDAHSILPRTRLLSGIPTRIDCGDQDGFKYVVNDLRAELWPAPDGGIESGGHDTTFWRAQAPAELRFVARHL